MRKMPEGYEFCESINGVVSVRKKVDESSRDIGDLTLVRAEMKRHKHLAQHRVELVKREIVVFEHDYGRYHPVMKFAPVADGRYTVHRMLYIGDGGWSYPLSVGALQDLAQEYVRYVGTEEFFELM